MGSLHSGDRLGSIREVARDLAEDPRAVARAYRMLGSGGLVEVRQRSGAFVAPQARFGGGPTPEVATGGACPAISGARPAISGARGGSRA